MREFAKRRKGVLLAGLLLLPTALLGDAMSHLGAGFGPASPACEPSASAEWLILHSAEPESGSEEAEEAEDESGSSAEPPPGGWAPVSGNPKAFRDALADEQLPPIAATNTPGTDTNLCMSWEVSAASDPNDPERLAIVQGATLGVSTDGGDNFTIVNAGAALPPGFTPNGDGTAAYDLSGRLFVAQLGNPVSAGGWQVFVSRHDPATGALISGPVSVSTAVGLATNANADKPWIAADAHAGSPFANRLYVVWSLTGGTQSGDFEVWGAVSTNQGANWSQMTRGGVAFGPISPVDGSDGQCWPSHVAVGRGGDVFVSYHGQPGFLIDPDGSGGPPDGISGKVVLLRSFNGGATFPQRSEPFPAGLADITRNSQSNQTGAIPDARFWTIGAGAGYILPDPNINCRVHVVADDDPDNDPTSGDAADVMMATSLNCGVTWPTRQRVSDGPAGSWQLLPAAAIDAETGAIAVTWLDNRNASSYPPGSAGNARADLRARYSLNGGVSWLPSVIVNDVPLDPDASTATIGSGIPSTYRIGEYNGVTFAECSAHMLWPGQATCNGTIDTYYDRDPQVADLDGPDIFCPDDVTLGCQDSPGPDATGSATARDDCDGDPQVIHVDANHQSSCPPTPVIDSFDRIWSATDAAGNIASCSQHISIEDFDAPVIHVPQALVISCSAQGGVPATDPQIQGWLAEGEAMDDCTTATLQVSGVPSLFPVGCNGEKTWVTFSSHDQCGNAGFEQSSVRVTDFDRPALAVPSPQVFECTETGGTPSNDPDVAAWLASPLTFDLCSVPTLTHDAPALLPASCAGHGTLVHFTSTDGCGNQTLASSTAVVIDTTGPDIVGPPVQQVLFPPNHGYVCFDDVAAAAVFEDACEDLLPGTAIACHSSQCDDAPCPEHPGEDGDGDTINDCTYDPGLDQLCARAERAETDPGGRLYTVTLTATDTCGNSNGEPILQIFVPHGCTEGDLVCIFLDGFESGNMLAWSAVSG